MRRLLPVYPNVVVCRFSILIILATLPALLLLPSTTISSRYPLTMPKKLVSSSSTNTYYTNESNATAAAAAATASAPNPSIPSTFTDNLPLPSLLVFDLDYTLWPFWVDTHVSGPLKAKDNNKRMVDRYGESFTFYPGVPAILAAARERGVAMGLASRTSAPELAREMLKGLVVVPPSPSVAAGSKPLRALDYFTHLQIYPGSKVTHFRRIQDATRKAAGGRGAAASGGGEVAFADMLFFDDEARNRDVENQLGVTFWLVRDGVTRDEIDNGVREWRRRRGIIGRAANGNHGDPDNSGAAELEA